MPRVSLRRAASARHAPIIAACSLALAIGPACGPPVDTSTEDQPSDGLPALHPLNLVMWNGTAQHGSDTADTMSPPDTPPDPTPPSDDPGSSGTPDTPTPTLVLSETQLDFDSKTIQRMFAIRQSGAGSLSYTVASDVPWVAVSPSAGTTAEGASDAISVTVDLAQLDSGEHTGALDVRADGGVPQEVGIRVVIDPTLPPDLAVSSPSLSFGGSETSLVLSLRNAGGGELTCQVSSDADWVTVSPTDGALTTVPLAVQVMVSRTPLLIGDHQALVTVLASNGQTATLPVNATKNVTSPQVVPWLDLNVYLQDHLAICRAGLDRWQYVTNAVVLQGGREMSFYRNIRADYPHLEIIPAMHTRYAVALPNFDSIAGWQTIAADVAKLAEAAGTNRVLLDHEIALQGYNEGVYDINMDQLRVALGCMPADIQILWYPAVYPSRLPNQPDALARTTRLCQTVAEVLDVRFVDLSYGSSEYWADTCSVMRQSLEAVVSQPTMPIAWFGCSPGYCWWKYEELPEAMQALSGRPDVLFYSLNGTNDWVQMADALVPQLQQP